VYLVAAEPCQTAQPLRCWWDNRCPLHACTDFGANDRRVMRRMTILANARREAGRCFACLVYTYQVNS
jgi:hypothetical protein